MVPSMLQMLLAQPLEDYDLSSLGHVVSGASPLAEEVIHEFERRVPMAEIREGYGLTETTGLVSGSWTTMVTTSPWANRGRSYADPQW
jgi:long-chain acyl-CoA synthetase